jgi:PAS domain S-box-containing protein
MTQEQGELEQLAAAQAQIQKISEQLAAEREAFQRLEDQIAQQQKDLVHREAQNHRLQRVLEASPATTYSYQATPPYACTYISQNIETVLGYSPEEFTAEPNFCVQRVHPDDAAQVFEGIPQLFAQGKLQRDYRMRHRDGYYVWLRDDMVLLRDVQGVPQEVVGYFTDITDRKAAEAIAHQQAEREALLRDITQQIRQTLDLEVVLTTAVDRVRQFLRVDRAVVYRFLPDWSGDFVAESVAEPWGKLLDPEMRQILTDTCLQEKQGSRFQNQETLAVANIYQAGFQPCHIELLERFQAKAFVVAPIFSGDTLWGLMAIYQNEDFRIWLDGEINLLQQIASQLGMGIYQASLYEQIQAELQQRQRTEAVSQQQLGAIESAVDGIAILQKDRYVYLNSAHVKLFGYETTAELMGQSWRILYSPEMLVQFEQTVFPSLQQQRYWQGEVVATRKDGTTFPEFLSLTLLDDNALVCICRDITAQKQVEQTIQEQKKFIESAIQTNPKLLVYLFDVPSQSLLFVSESVANLLAYTAAEILAMGADLVPNLVHPDDHLGFAAYINQLDQSPPGTSLAFEYRVRHRDGRWLDLLLRGQVHTRDEQGHVQQFLGSVTDITSRKRTEAHLQASEARFETIANLVPDFLWESEPNGFNTWCNQRWLDYTGQTLEQALGRGWLEAIHPDDRAQSVLIQRDAAETGEPRREERRIRRHDGEYRWFVSNVSPVTNAAGEVIKVYGAVTDVHEERMAREALQASAAIDAFRVRLSDVLRSFTNPIHIPAEACHLLGEQLDVDRVFYIAFDEAAGMSQVDREYVRGDSPSLIGEYPTANYCWSLPYLRRGETIVIADTQSTAFITEGEQAKLRDAHLIGMLSIPLIKNGALVGALVASESVAREWTAAEVDLVCETAERLWTTMQRVEAEAAVKDLSERLALALQAGSIGTWDWDCVNEVNWDDQMYVLYGLQNLRERAIYLTWRNSLHPDDRDRVEALLQAALRGEATYDTEFRIQRPTGELRWIQAIAQVKTDHQGNPIRMVGINQDITERKTAEAALNAQTNRLTLALEAGFYGVGEWDFVNLPDWDDQLYKIYGLQDLGRPVTYQDWRDLLHPDDASQAEATLAQTPEMHNVLTAEFRIVRPDGQLRWVQAFAQAERDAEGNPLRMVSITQDITERKQAEAALQAQTNRLSLALQAGAFGIWEWDLGDNRVWDDRVYKIYGLQNLGRPATYQDWRAIVHPADLERVEDQVQRSLTRELPFYVEFRICRPDGEQRWVQTFAQVQRDAAGRPVRMVGINQDITARKQTEADLQAQTNRLSLSLEAGAFGIWEWDFVHAPVWDDRMYEIYGLQDLGRPVTYQDWRSLVHPEDILRMDTQIEQSLESNTVISAEIRFERPDGELRWVQVFAQVQRDAEGNPVRLVGINQDITARKQTEIALQAQTDRLSLALQAGAFGIWEWDLGQKRVWDDRTYEIYGLQDLGQPTTHHDWRACIHPDDADQLEAELQASLAGEASVNAEFRIWRPDGQLRWLQSFAQVQRDAVGHPMRMVGITRDITEKKETEAELQLLADRLSLALLAGQIGFWLWDLDQSLFWDTSLCRLYGLSETDQVTDWKTWRDLVHPEDLDRVEALLEAAIHGAPYLGTEFRIYRTDGELRWIQSSAYVQRDENGQPVQMIGINQDITARKQAELALQEQTSRLTLALRAGSYGIWEWDLVSDPIWDERIYEDYGLQNLGRPITYQDWRNRIHPDDLHWVEAQLEADLRTRIPFSAEFRICRTDGELRWVLSTAKLYCDGQGQPLRMVGIHQDITHRKLAEQELWNSRAKFQRLVDDIGDKFVVFSHTGTIITYVSGGFQAVFGVPPEGVLGKSWADSIRWLPENLKLAQAENQRLLTDRVPSQEFEMSFIHPDGNIRTVHVVQHPVWDEAGNLLAIEGVVEDITARKAAEAELRRTNAELERATRLKDEFLANMSHELRTPLNAILGMTEGLQEKIFGPLTERQQRSLATIERSSSHLLSLINDILDLSKIEAGQVELDFEAIGVGPLCSTSIAFVKQQAHKKRQQITTLIPNGLPDLYGDDRRLRQVLINLLTNAVKFTPKAGQITLAASYIALTPDAASPWAFTHPQANPGDTLGLLSISITDTGIGISPADAQRLFQPFVQVNTALNRQYEGTGLGLSLVKRIVEMHGGEVTLTSDVGVGSCFTVQLPIIAIPNTATPPARFTVSNTAPPPVDPAKAPLILLAEDNEANISTTSSYLEAKGYRLIIARDGLEATNLATTDQPDLILMDIQMPQIDGLEAIRQIRQNPALATVPIVALTALAMPADQERCLAAGANHYLSKPIRLKQLSQLITTLLAKDSPASSLG